MPRDTAESLMKPFDLEVQQCIQHLQSHASHYFSVIHNKRQQGVLWAVFAPTDTGAGTAARIVVKRASFLPLSTILSTNAPSLIQMYDHCDHSKQFVCWFTVESADGQPLVSKVTVVDAPVQCDTGSTKRSHDEPKGMPHDVHSSPTGRPSTAISELKADMEAFEVQRRRTAAEPRRPAVTKTTVGAAQHRSSSQPAGSTGDSNKQVMRISMQLADSVEEMGAGLEELRNTVTKLKGDVDSASKHNSADFMNALLMRIDTMEHQQEELDRRLHAFEDMQGRYFDRLEALQSQVAALSLQTKRVDDPAEREVREPISYARLAESKLKREPTSMRLPTASSQTLRVPVVETSFLHSEGDESDADPPPTTVTPSGVVSGKGKERTGPSKTPALLTVPPSSGGRGTDVHHTKHAEQAEHAADQDGESLSDMIKTMERKLSRLAPSSSANV